MYIMWTHGNLGDKFEVLNDNHGQLLVKSDHYKPANQNRGDLTTMATHINSDYDEPCPHWTEIMRIS